VAALPEPAVDEAAFRAALGRFATGVAFVTAETGGARLGLIVSSFTSVSLRPPLISFCPSRDSLTWRRMRAARAFAVNVLAAPHAGFARRAAEPGADRFDATAVEPGVTGAPIMRDALAAIECTIEAQYPAGDHWLVIGGVRRVHQPADGDPLVYWGGDFGHFERYG
jgi:flavin reductase (DIM6/NTAB) family NADH-FMN oxidoreductase RutF